MSKHNKANKNNYDQSGRLTPDEMARQRSRMRDVTNKTSQTEERMTGRGGDAPARDERQQSGGGTPRDSAD